MERALDTLDAVYAELGGDLCTARYQRGIEVEIRVSHHIAIDTYSSSTYDSVTLAVRY